MRALAAFTALSLFAVVPACGGSRSPAQNVGMLRSPDADERRDAAHALRNDGGPTPEATQALLDAIKSETDDRTYGEMLISLGASGVPQAEAFICPKVYANDARTRNVAKRALKLYLEHNRGSQGCPPPGSQPGTTASAQAPVPGNAVPTAPAASPTAGVTIGPTK